MAGPSAVSDVPMWWHSIELPDGTVTPGHKTPTVLAAELDALHLPPLSGKSILDVGAWDGYFSFAAERLGADRVVALDFHSWSVPDDQRGFDLAHRLLDSRVEAVLADFMAVDLDALGTFDVVLFLGMLYHFREPIVSLERLRALTSGSAYIETEAIALPGYEAIAACEFYESDELAGDPTNWWAPTAPALVGMCRAAGFASAELLVGPPEDPDTDGRAVHFRAVVRADTESNPHIDSPRD